MKIVDLSYCENVSEKVILGGPNATIGATALAEGDDALTLADIELNLRTLNNGKLKLKGGAEALAVGDYALVDTYYDLDGFNKVKVKTKSKEGSNFVYEKLKIKAMS